MLDLKKILNEEKLRNLRLRPSLCLEMGSPLGAALEEMKKARTGCALVLGADRRIVGIFTERDALGKVWEQKPDPKTPIERFMTPDPKVLKMDDSVAEAIRLMNQGGYRHIPIVDSGGGVRGVVSVRDILSYLAEHFPYEVYNLPPDPRQIARAPEGA